MGLLAILVALLLQSEPNPLLLEGNWKITESIENGNKVLTFARVTDSTSNFTGHYMKFSANHTYEEYSISESGSGEDQFHYSGKWKIDQSDLCLEKIQVKQNRQSLYLIFKVHDSGKLKMISVNSNEIKYIVTKSWESIHERR